MPFQIRRDKDSAIEILKDGFKRAFEEMSKAIIKATFASKEWQIALDHIVVAMWPLNFRQRVKSWLCFFTSHQWIEHDPTKGCVICRRCRRHLFTQYETAQESLKDILRSRCYSRKASRH